MEAFKGQSILNFIKELPDDEACKAYLAKIKWKDGSWEQGGNKTFWVQTFSQALSSVFPGCQF